MSVAELAALPGVRRASELATGTDASGGDPIAPGGGLALWSAGEAAEERVAPSSGDPAAFPAGRAVELTALPGVGVGVAGAVAESAGEVAEASVGAELSAGRAAELAALPGVGVAGDVAEVSAGDVAGASSGAAFSAGRAAELAALPSVGVAGAVAESAGEVAEASVGAELSASRAAAPGGGLALWSADKAAEERVAPSSGDPAAFPAGRAAELTALPGVSTAGGMAAARARARVTGRVLPVRPELRELLPEGGLRRGSTVAVRGSTSLLLALLAEATATGSWAAAVGMPDLGLVAAGELGVEVGRLALVPRPGAELASVTAALLDGMDLVAVVPGGTAPSVARRLSARARHRGAVLLSLGPWPGAELELGYETGEWTGLDAGAGHLRARQAGIRVTGRGSAARPRFAELMLPGPAEATGHRAPAPRLPWTAEPASVQEAGWAGEAAAGRGAAIPAPRDGTQAWAEEGVG